MILSLQYLRGIASLLVVLYHARGEMNYAYAQQNLGDILFGNGYIGVDLFFMVSGFVIMLSTEKDSSVSAFLTKRLFRIYPVYLACLFFTVYAFDFNYDINLLKAILFINEDISSRAPWFGYTIVFTAWTLMFEIIFYLYFSISMMISKKHRGLVCSILLTLTVILINTIYGNGIPLSGYDAISIKETSNWMLSFARVLSSPMFYEFIAGIFIYWVYKYLNVKYCNDISIIFLPFSLACFGLFYITGYNGGHGLFNCGIYAAALLLSLIMYEKCHTIRSNRTLNFLGDISYSLYLTHPIVVNLLSYGVLVTSAYSKGKGFGNVYLILMASIIISTILFNFVEKPFVRLSRKILNKISRSNMAV